MTYLAAESLMRPCSSAVRCFLFRLLAATAAAGITTGGTEGRFTGSTIGAFVSDGGPAVEGRCAEGGAGGLTAHDGTFAPE
jgi:hypothetical protein